MDLSSREQSTDVMSECNILMYADDTVLYCSAILTTSIEAKLNKELLKIERWFLDNGLFLNIMKTEAMLFGTAVRISSADLLILI